jgi:hypothetical protein
LKGVGPLTYHFGCDYFRDHDGTLCFGPRKYFTKMMDQFKKKYGCKQKEYTSPLEKGYHPEIDTLKNVSLSKRHTLAYHCVREMIAANIHCYYWVDGKNNPADCVSKHWSYLQIWHLLKPLLFYSENTQDLLDSKEDNTIMDNKINASSQETSYHMFPTYNDNK